MIEGLSETRQLLFTDEQNELLENESVDDLNSRIDGFTCLYIGAIIDAHLNDPEGFKDQQDDLVKQNGIAELIKTLTAKVEPLLKTRRKADLDYAVKFIVHTVYEKGIRDGLYEAEIQLLARADKYSPKEASAHE